MPLKIVRNDITQMNTDAIVNTANSFPVVGSGCDSAIYQAAGYNELLAIRKEIGEVKEGEAFITPGLKLPAKYIIHTVSPLFVNGEMGEEELLRNCYRNSLKLAKEKGLHSIAFPLISTGSFMFPKEEGIRVAADEINEFLLHNSMDVFLVVFDEQATKLVSNLTEELDSYIDQNYVEIKEREEYPVFSSARYAAPSPSGGGRPRGFFGNLLGGKQKESAVAQHMMSAPAMAKPVREELKDSCADEVFVDDEDVTRKINERMKYRTFSQYLMFLIEQKGLENVEVYRSALVDKKTFSKIKNNEDYHPQKITALCLCMGAKLNYDEAKDLLARAGYAFSPCDKTDLIFSYFIENEIYDMVELDIQLENHGLPCLIA